MSSIFFLEEGIFQYHVKLASDNEIQKEKKKPLVYRTHFANL